MAPRTPGNSKPGRCRETPPRPPPTTERRERPKLTDAISRIEHLVAHGVADRAIAAFLDAAVKSRLNLVVAGGTNTGKTTLLRCLLNAVPPEERIITIEDVDEIGSDAQQPDLVAVQGRPSSLTESGETTIEEWIRHAMRMNPTRIIVGDVRERETTALLTATNTGVGAMWSVHANSSSGALMRVMRYAMGKWDKPTAARRIGDGLDLIVHLKWIDGVRRITSIREVTAAPNAAIVSNAVFHPGSDGRAVPGPTISYHTLDRISNVGFDMELLQREGGWWEQ